MKNILQNFPTVSLGLLERNKNNISNLGLSFDWRKHDWKASNSSQSFKIFSSSLGKSWFSAAPAAIKNESLWPKEQKNRNDDNLGLINRQGFNKRVPERYFHMETKRLDLSQDARVMQYFPEAFFRLRRSKTKWRPLT